MSVAKVIICNSKRERDQQVAQGRRDGYHVTVKVTQNPKGQEVFIVTFHGKKKK
jgi:hypothetical protein